MCINIDYFASKSCKTLSLDHICTRILAFADNLRHWKIAELNFVGKAIRKSYEERNRLIAKRTQCHLSLYEINNRNIIFNSFCRGISQALDSHKTISLKHQISAKWIHTGAETWSAGSVYLIKAAYNAALASDKCAAKCSGTYCA